MGAVAEPGRIAALDTVRGVAVMGILAMNIVAFAMPFQAYMNPFAYGLESAADFWSWVFSFVFIDGRMRGLFSFLFGASTLLVIEKAEAAGGSAATSRTTTSTSRSASPAASSCSPCTLQAWRRSPIPPIRWVSSTGCAGAPRTRKRQW